MKSPDINIKDEDIKKDYNHITVNIKVPEFDISACEIQNLDEYDEKRIKTIERLIRASYEYRSFIQYIKTELKITRDMIIPGLDSSKYHIGIEIHHYPFTLYEITEILGKYLISNNKNADRGISNFDIAELVLKEHYLGNIGLLPLSESVHIAYHNGRILIPWDCVYSKNNVDNFVIKYRKYITDQQYDNYISCKTIDPEKAKENNKELLKKITVDYNVDYVKPENTEEEA